MCLYVCVCVHGGACMYVCVFVQVGELESRERERELCGTVWSVNKATSRFYVINLLVVGRICQSVNILNIPGSSEC